MGLTQYQFRSLCCMSRNEYEGNAKIDSIEGTTTSAIGRGQGSHKIQSRTAEIKIV